MSKSMQMTIYTKNDFKCCLKNVASLLNMADWSISDSEGKIAYWNEATSEWECFNGTTDEFLRSGSTCWFHAYRDMQIIMVCVDSDHSFVICPEAYCRCTSAEFGKHFDFNWYYEHTVQMFNKNETIVERVIFEEY